MVCDMGRISDLGKQISDLRLDRPDKRFVYKRGGRWNSRAGRFGHPQNPQVFLRSSYFTASQLARRVAGE